MKVKSDKLVALKSKLQLILMLRILTQVQQIKNHTKNLLVMFLCTYLPSTAFLFQFFSVSPHCKEAV